ncbi:MAG: phosphoribosyltransferase [Anaerolineales bacterium]|nr:MAG: phosphoribosyltransferase [Anaerolineales bacterium]
MQFRDRREAGQLLAEELSSLRGTQDLIILGIPRGGVVVAYEVAKALSAPLDVYITRKIGAPFNPELAVGAVASGGTLVLDHDLIARVGASDDYIQTETERQRQEIERRMAAYRGARSAPDLQAKTVILVDDGVATGATVLASLRAIKQHQPARLILAVPVGPPDTIRLLSQEADRVVCLFTPEVFWAVGSFYSVFDQTTDAEVVQLLEERQ